MSIALLAYLTTSQSKQVAFVLSPLAIEAANASPVVTGMSYRRALFML